MKLVKLKLKNFRCYQADTELEIDSLVALIGKNDVGKSSILEALDAFFNDNIDEADLSNDADSKSVELTCFFDGISDQVVLDTSTPTSPTEEGILNSDGQLEVKKVFTFSGRKSSAIFIMGYHPSDERLRDLLSKKNSALKNLADELGIDTKGIKSKNPPIRQKIREYIGGGRSLTQLKVDGNVDNEDNLKAIWSSLKKTLPIFSLFKVDKTLDDKDGDIQDPMKVAVNEALALPEIQTLLEQVEEKVRQASTAVADKTIEKLKDFDESLSERLKSEFSKSPAYNKIFDLTLLNENNIPLNKRGSGIRRLVLLSFFQAQAERRKADGNAPSIIYAIEEPETSQHPNHQLMLIEALVNLSKQTNVQVLFSTHSANLVREIPPQSLRYIWIDSAEKLVIENAYSLESKKINEDVVGRVVKTLGILPNPADRVKVLVFVEGNHDVNALKRYSSILHAVNGTIDLFKSNEVGYVITGGSALKHYIEQKHLEGLGKPEVHIYDSDVADYKSAVAKINAENNPRKVAFNTNKLELENYLHHDAISDAYIASGIKGCKLPAFSDTTDVPKFVAEYLCKLNGNDWESLPEDKQKELGDGKKKFLNSLAVEKMTVERLREKGGLEEISNWLATIGSFLA